MDKAHTLVDVKLNVAAVFAATGVSKSVDFGIMTLNLIVLVPINIGRDCTFCVPVTSFKITVSDPAGAAKHAASISKEDILTVAEPLKKELG